MPSIFDQTQAELIVRTAKLIRKHNQEISVHTLGKYMEVAEYDQNNLLISSSKTSLISTIVPGLKIYPHSMNALTVEDYVLVANCNSTDDTAVAIKLKEFGSNRYHLFNEEGVCFTDSLLSAIYYVEPQSPEPVDLDTAEDINLLLNTFE